MPKTVAATLCFLTVVSLCVVAAAAQPRGRNAAQVRKMQQQFAFMQLEMLRYQSEMAAKLQEISKSFDENGDGRLTGGEQGRYEKHMREIRTGKVVNPFAAITPLGMGKRPKSPIAELERQAASHNAAVLAKQREIYNSFDENGDGNLTGAEKARFDKHMHAIQTGAVPNPFAAAGSGTAGKR